MSAEFFMKMNLLLESYNCHLRIIFLTFCSVEKFICLGSPVFLSFSSLKLHSITLHDCRSWRIYLIKEVEIVFCSAVHMNSRSY